MTDRLAEDPPKHDARCALNDMNPPPLCTLNDMNPPPLCTCGVGPRKVTVAEMGGAFEGGPDSVEWLREQYVRQGRPPGLRGGERGVSDLWPEIAGLPDAEPMTFGELIGQAAVPDQRVPGWRSALPDPHAQRLEAMVRERERRKAAEDALNRLREAVEAHRRVIPPRNARKADRALWETLEAIGGDDG